MKYYRYNKTLNEDGHLLYLVFDAKGKRTRNYYKAVGWSVWYQLDDPNMLDMDTELEPMEEDDIFLDLI